MRLRTASKHWNVPGKYGPHGELFCSFLKKEPMVLSKLVEFGPCFSADTVKACGMIGLHIIAEENAFPSDKGSSPDHGEVWKHGCPKSPVWSDDGLEEERGEDASSVEYYEHNVDNLAIEVVGQNWSCEGRSGGYWATCQWTCARSHFKEAPRVRSAKALDGL